MFLVKGEIGVETAATSVKAVSGLEYVSLGANANAGSRGSVIIALATATASLGLPPDDHAIESNHDCLGCKLQLRFMNFVAQTAPKDTKRRFGPSNGDRCRILLDDL